MVGNSGGSQTNQDRLIRCGGLASVRGFNRSAATSSLVWRAGRLDDAEGIYSSTGNRTYPLAIGVAAAQSQIDTR